MGRKVKSKTCSHKPRNTVSEDDPKRVTSNLTQKPELHSKEPRYCKWVEERDWKCKENEALCTFLPKMESQDKANEVKAEISVKTAVVHVKETRARSEEAMASKLSRVYRAGLSARQGFRKSDIVKVKADESRRGKWTCKQVSLVIN